MKVLAVCSSLELEAPLSATPAWWQLLKALSEAGTQVVVTTYHGRAPDSPWWSAYPNPARLEGELFSAARHLVRRISPNGHSRGDAGEGETLSQQIVRRTARALIAPRWRRHLARVLAREDDVDAVLFLGVPPNHLRGVARHVRDRRSIPVYFYDGDAPASLPAFQGFATGFRIYDDADLSEFDAILCNSESGAAQLRQMGARAVHTLHYAADPGIYRPLNLPQDIDIFFYGHTAEYRQRWLHAMLTAPSVAMPEARFAARGRQLGELGRVELLPYAAFGRLPEYVARSRINLVITRDTHASSRGSSTMRPFELAMARACMVANPYDGIEQWFEPGREIVIVQSEEEATERYRFLLSHERERVALGEAARRRALGEHTYGHRAARLLEILAGRA
jgi:glycosyltransferase involved in cell wall biosynthesis